MTRIGQRDRRRGKRGQRQRRRQRQRAADDPIVRRGSCGGQQGHSSRLVCRDRSRRQQLVTSAAQRCGVGRPVRDWHTISRVRGVSGSSRGDGGGSGAGSGGGCGSTVGGGSSGSVDISVGVGGDGYVAG